MYYLLLWIVAVFQVPKVEDPVVHSAVTAPGGNTTLKCSFAASENLNITNLIINWQHENTVVHSFYHGTDQLDRQEQTYRGRTHLFKDKLTEGNASLWLTSVQPSDEGEYTCYVSNEQGSTREKLRVILAAPYDEPILSLQPTCDSINITVTFSNGFPQPQLRWLDFSGRDINETDSSVRLDDRGLYEVSSTIDFKSNSIETITMEMKLEVLGQNFTRSLLLHPLPDPCQECCSTTPSTSPNTTAVVLVLLTVVFALLIFAYLLRKYKRRQPT